MTFKALFATALFITMPAVVLADHATTAQAAYEEAMGKMMQDMKMPMSGDADKDFAMMMMHHHQGAIDMAEVELKYGKDETLRAMAGKIIEAQKKEIQELKDWQASNP